MLEHSGSSSLIIFARSTLQDSTPSLYQVKIYTKSVYDYELKYTSLDRENIFEKRGLLKDYYDNR